MSIFIKKNDDDLSLSMSDDLSLDDDSLSLEDEKESVFSDVEYNDDPEHDYKEELTAVQQKFRADRKREADTMRDTFNSNYYCVIVFDSEPQKKSFLSQLGWDFDGNRFLDGVSIAKKIGIDLPEERAFDLRADAPFLPPLAV